MDWTVSNAKPRWTRAFFVACAACAIAWPASSQALEDEDLVDYDSIVSDLNREVSRPLQSRTKLAPRADDPFATLLFHTGVGFASSVQSVGFSDGQRAYLNLKGVQWAGGIDLFSEHAMAEGTVKSLTSDDTGTNRASLQEFELKFVYRDRLSRTLGFRAGGGLAVRYLRFDNPTDGIADYTTPSSVGTLGLDFFLSDRFSIGIDFNARTSMIAETIDRNSFDGTLRLDLHL